MEDGDLPKVTLTHLRRAEQMCRRRLAEEHRGRWGNPAGAARFAVANRIVADAAVAHSELRSPARADFPTPDELRPEQQHLYDAAATGYLVLFGERPARTLDLDLWESRFEELGVRVVGNPGLALQAADGTCELRVLRLANAARAAFDGVDRRALALRVAGSRWRVVVADLLGLTCEETLFDAEAEEPAARAWFAERLQAIRALADDARPRAGADCNGCPFVAGCPLHREA